MQHMIFWHGQEVIEHLFRFRFLNLPVYPIAVRLHKVLVDKFADAAPHLPILHHQEVVAAGDQVGDEGDRPMRIDAAFLINEIFD
jgi:hypothetical protein